MPQIQFLGSGDAFGSGGRLQTCMLLSGGPEAATDPMLIDCGATSLVAMKRAGVDPSSIGTVAISHLHGDHFAGLPFLILDGQFSRRELPLAILGPAGIETRVLAAMEAMFPGSSSVSRRFPVVFHEVTSGEEVEVGPAKATAFAAEHASGAPALALRVEYGGRTVAYSGDTEWTDELVAAAAGADLFVCEGYTFEKKVKFHLDYATLLAHREALTCKRIILTHMTAEMLSRTYLAFERASDGLVVEL